MPDIYLPREIANAWDGDNFVQDAWKQVSDIWAQQANAASPDLALQAEQQVQQKAIEDQRAQERAAYQQQSDAATQAGLQQAMQEQYGQQQAQQWAAQAYGQAATAATGVAPLPTAPAAPAATDQGQPAPDQAQPAQPAQPAPSASGMPSGAAGNYVAAAWQAAQKYGLDPSVFVRQIQQESGFQPFMPDGSVKVSPAGARGIAQFMPGTAKDVGVNPDDPLASLDAAAKTMSGYVQRYGGDMAKALAAYNAGPGNVDKFGGVPPFSETQDYVKIILGDAAGLGSQLAAKAQQGLGDLGQAATGAAQAAQDTGAAAAQQAQDAGAGAMRVVNAAVQTVAGDLRPSQFGVGLSSSEAEAACGPVAAMAFARATGRNPTAEEAVQLAKQVGWTAANGMAGPASELSLLKSMGVAAHLEQGADPTKIAQDVNNGNPVIISTPGHYFVADKVDSDGSLSGTPGAFHVGTSGTDLRAGSAWMSLGQMQKVMGQAQATLYLDRQPGDGPSVAAQMTQGGDSQQQPQAQQAQPQQPLTMSAMQPADIPSAPANGPSGFNPFRSVGDLAGSVGSTVGGALGSLLGAGGGLLNRPQAGPADNPGALASPATPPSSPDQLPFGGRTAADLLTEPLKPVAQGAAGLLGQALQPADQGAADLLGQPGGPLAGPKAAAAGALNDLAGQVPANVPVVGGALNAAAGLITAPTILDNVQTMQDLAQKYPSRVPGLPDVSSMTPEDQQAYQNASVAVGGVASPSDYLHALRVGSLAGGIPTLSHIAINTPIQAGLKLLGDVPTAVVTGRAETIPSEFVGMWKGLETWAQNASQVLGHQGPIGQSVGGGAAGQALETGLLGLVKTHPVLQDAARQVGTSMEMWRQAAQQATDNGLKPLTGAWQTEVQRLVANPTSDMIDAAQRVGNRFALGGPLGTQGQKMADYLKGNPIGQFILPFFNIGYHVAAQGVETSPAGLLGTGYDVLRASVGKGPYAGAKGFSGTGGANAVTPLAERVRNNMIGLGLSIGAYNLAAQGLITGNGPDDANKRQELLDQGWMPDAVMIGGRYFDAHVLGPVAAPLIGAANVYEATTPPEQGGYAKPGASGMDQFGNFLGREGQYFENETFLKSLGQVLQVIGSAKDAGRAGSQELGSVLQSVIPQGALLGNVASAMDPLSRKPAVGDYAQALEQRIPGLREQLPARITRSGQPEPNPQAGLGILLPRNTEARPDPMLQFLGASGVALGPAPKTITPAPGRDIQLTPEEQQQFMDLRGQVLQQMTAPLIGNAQFAAAPIAARNKALDRVVQRANQAATAQVASQIAQSGGLAGRLQTAAQVSPPIPLSTPLPLQTSTSSAASIQPPRSLQSLPLTSDFSDLDPIQQQEMRRRLAGVG